MRKSLFAAILVFSFSFYGIGWAASIYVSPAGGGDGTIGNPTDLQTALNMAKAVGENDTLYLQQGTYTSANTYLYNPTGTDTYTVTLLGGWNTDFSSQSADRTLTMLDGQSARRVLDVTGDGAGIDMTFSLQNLTIQNGRTAVASQHGAGIRSTNTNGARVNVILRRCLIQGNAAATNSGGGGMYSTCSFEIYESTFSSNQSTNYGGALYASYAPPYTQSNAPIIERCVFQNNTNPDLNPGAHVFNQVSLLIKNCTFNGRTDGQSSGGSAIYSYTNSFLTLLDCVFSGNVATYWGGAVQFWAAGGDIKNCLFINNRAGSIGNGAGGALTMFDPTYPSSKTVTVTNSTFVGNMTAGYQGAGGAIHNRRQTANVSNCIFWNNGVPNGQSYFYGGMYALIVQDSGAGTVSYSDVQGGLGSTGFTDGGSNINLDPQFVGGANYRLAAGSPCIDAGNNSAPGLPLFDMERNGRIYDGNKDGTATVDMGPFEFSSNISVMPGAHDFGTIATGSASAPYTFTISNDGQASLEIGTLLLAGADASAFSLQNDGCSDQAVVASGLCTFEVIFSPATVGGKNATLSIPSDDPDTATVSVFVSGNAVPVANISVNPASKDFTVINVGSSSGFQTLTISNIGTADLVIGTTSLTGADAADFSIRNDHCSGQTILPSGNCTLQARFSPTGEGSRSANLSIPSNDPDMSTVTAPLTGQGTIQSVFNDCPESYWAEDFINTLFYSGVTGGCGGSNYCPDNPVTRAQMAVFIISAMGEMPSTAAYNTHFDDIVNDGFAPFINRMSELGIAAGCGDRAYCPNNLLTRAQMAVFIIAAMGESGSTAAYNSSFDDIANDGFAGFINRMNELGITGGCGDRAYCPGNSTNRAMMAVFLVTAF